MIKKSVLFLTICALAASWGCSNYKEPETLGIVSGIAIDKVDDDFRVTNEIVELHGSDITATAIITSGEGNTIIKAVENSEARTGKTLYYGHMQSVIISEKAAEEDILQIMDFVNAQDNVPLSLRILVAPNKAFDILGNNQEQKAVDIAGFELAKLLCDTKHINSSPDMPYYNFVRDMDEGGIEAVLPTVRLVEENGQKTPFISGAAVFKGTRLVGFLENDMARAFLMVRNMTKIGIIAVKTSDHSEVFEIKKCSCKIKPKLDNSKIMVDINIQLEVKLSAERPETDMLFEKNRVALETDCSAEVKSELEKLAAILQKKYDSDVFGIGRILSQRNPKEWEKLKKSDKEYFKNAEINFNVETNLEETGRMY